MESGAVVGEKYRLVRRVGKGGMGSVWAATRIADGRPVAVKLLHAEAANSAELRERLLREAGAASRIHHPNVVEFLEVGFTDEGEPFLVMELLQGQTLRQLLRDRGKLDSAAALWIACEVARALAAAHAAGIAHRDLKPSNVFLHRESEGVVVKVLDFGVSKFLSEEHATMTSTGQAIGSPAYMSPEQAKGDRIDHRTDLWSLGVLLFEMLAGTRPFHADSPVALLSQILFGKVQRLREACPDIDPVIDAIVSRCLERRVDARYQFATQVLEALEARRAALAEAEAAQRAQLGEWVTNPPATDAEVPQSSATIVDATSADHPPSTTGQSAATTSNPTGAGAQSSSTAHGMYASLAAHSASVSRVHPPSRALPRVPIIALIFPATALFALVVSLLLLFVRTRHQERERELSDVAEPSSTTAAPVATPLPSPAPTAARTHEPPDASPTAARTHEPPDAAPTSVPTPPQPPASTRNPRPVTPPVAPPVTVKPKTCKSPIVDATGKVIGCLD